MKKTSHSIRLTAVAAGRVHSNPPAPGLEETNKREIAAVAEQWLQKLPWTE